MLQRITLPLLVLGPGGAAWSSTSPFHSQTGLSQQQHHYRQQPQLGVAKLPIAEPDKSEGQIAEEMSRAQRLIDFLDACPEVGELLAELFALELRGVLWFPHHPLPF